MRYRHHRPYAGSKFVLYAMEDSEHDRQLGETPFMDANNKAFAPSWDLAEGQVGQLQKKIMLTEG
jgi:hypothetical protein